MTARYAMHFCDSDGYPATLLTNDRAEAEAEAERLGGKVVELKPGESGLNPDLIPGRIDK